MDGAPRGPKALAVVWLGIPIVALTAGIPLANRVEPAFFGFPFLLDYIVAWILISPLFGYLAYRVQGDD